MTMFARVFDVGRLCRWTAYSVGARHSRLMSEPYPQSAHMTVFRLPDRTSAGLSRRVRNLGVQDSPEGGVEPIGETGVSITQWEAEQLEGGELEISKVLQSWERAKSRLVGRAKLRLVEVRRLWREARHHDQRHEAKGFASPQEWSPWILWLFLVALAVPEFPLTRSAFEVFRLDRTETQVAALGCSLVLILLAHFTGRALRQGEWGVLPGIVTAMLLIGLISLAAIRADFVERSESSRTTVRAAEISKLTARAAETGMDITDLVEPFTSVNAGLLHVGALGALAALFVVAGVVVGHQAHDSDQGLTELVTSKERAVRRLRRSQRRFVRAAAAYDGARGSVERRIEAERERTLMSIREYRHAAELWRLPSLNRPDSFAGSIDERFFKPRDVGPELWPACQALDDLVWSAHTETSDVAVEDSHGLVVARMEEVHA